MRAKKTAAEEASRAIASRPKSSATTKGNDDRKGKKGRRKGDPNGEKGSLGGKGVESAQGSAGSKGKATGMSEEGPRNVYAQSKGSHSGKGKATAACEEGPKNVYAQPRPLEGKGKSSKGASVRQQPPTPTDMPALHTTLAGAKGGTAPGAGAGTWGKGSAVGGWGPGAKKPQETTATEPAARIPAAAKTPAPIVQAQRSPRKPQRPSQLRASRQRPRPL